MILLITSKFDNTTNIVIRWLNYYKTPYKRLNTESYSVLNYYFISQNKVKMCIGDLDLNIVNTVWHRRGRLKHLPNSLDKLNELTVYLKNEENSLIKSIENYLRCKTNYIGSYIKEVENYKLDYLLIAKKCGIMIPETLVTTSKVELLKFHSNYNKIITKDIRYPINLKNDKIIISSVGTLIVSKKNIEILSENFAPIFVQKYIEKEFEIRIFFIDDNLFSMAIFSQNDKQTKVDFRNYNKLKPNRNIPFNLPKDVKIKILNFIKKTELNTGSIDLIYSKNKKFVFLEVNPMGQFDWLSKNCNYYIEKKIAKKLIING